MNTALHDPARLVGAPGLIDPNTLRPRQRALLRFIATWANVVRTPQGWGLRGDGTGEHFTDTLVNGAIDKGLVRKELFRSRVWRLVLTGSGQNTLAVMDLRETARRQA